MTVKTFDVSIIIPKEATNLVTNPSFETGLTTGYTLLQSAIAVDTTQQRREFYSMKITPNANQIAGAYYALSLSSGVQYSFSCDILDVVGQTFDLKVADVATGTETYASAVWVGTGYWKRRYVTFTPATSAGYNFYLLRSTVNSVTPFYTDGWQIETGAVSTYLDGNMTGYVSGEIAYRWNGTQNASSSYRSGQTRSGGTFLKLSTLGIVLAMPGLGMGPITNIGLSSTLGGSFYQNTIYNERPFSIVMNIKGSGDWGVIEAARKTLINAVKPDATINRQPLLIQCNQLDPTGLEVAETVNIPCLYEGGLEIDGSENSYNAKTAMTFKMYMPLMRQEGEKAIQLGYQTTVTNANNIIARDSNGTWAAMGTGSDGNLVVTITAGPDGSIYAGGLFAQMGGVANTAYIAKWNGTAWSALATGASAYVKALVVGPDGSLYAGGNFLNLGTANGDYIAKWNGAAWSALGYGTDGVVRTLVFGTDGNLYVGGDFTHVGNAAAGDLAASRIAKWDGTTWSALGTGAADNNVQTLVASSSAIYAGGSFTLMGGVANTPNIAKWNGATWSALSTGAGNVVYTLAISPDGNLYAGGLFTTIGGVSANFIAKWNGTAWSALGSGTSSQVNSLFAASDGTVYAGGHFIIAGGVILSGFAAQWNGSSWFPLDVNLPGASPYVDCVFMDKAKKLYVGYETSGSATSATVTVPNVGSSTAYPRVVFTGPGTTYQIKNYTTGKAIYLGLTLLAGETAILDLDPNHVNFTSSFRGNIMNTVLPGSDLSFGLLPGANSISAFMYGGTTGATKILMYWRDQYWSLDGAIN